MPVHVEDSCVSLAVLLAACIKRSGDARVHSLYSYNDCTTQALSCSNSRFSCESKKLPQLFLLSSSSPIVSTSEYRDSYFKKHNLALFTVSI